MKNFYQNIADGWMAATYSYARGCRYTLQGTPVGWGPSSTHLDQSSFFTIPCCSCASCRVLPIAPSALSLKEGARKEAHLVLLKVECDKGRKARSAEKQERARAQSQQRKQKAEKDEREKEEKKKAKIEKKEKREAKKKSAT